MSLGGGSTRVHLEIYELLPPVIAEHPLFGLGLNTFSTFFGHNLYDPEVQKNLYRLAAGLVDEIELRIFPDQVAEMESRRRCQRVAG